MRLAQVIFDKNDSEFEAKVKQVYLWQRILLFGSIIFLVTSVTNNELDICEEAN